MIDFQFDVAKIFVKISQQATHVLVAVVVIIPKSVHIDQRNIFLIILKTDSRDLKFILAHERNPFNAELAICPCEHSANDHFFSFFCNGIKLVLD